MVNTTPDENLEASLSSLNTADLFPGGGREDRAIGGQEQRLWNSMSIVDSTTARPHEMLPLLRPGRAQRSSALSSSSDPHRQCGHLRPDGWVGKKNTRRSWRVKSISNVSGMMVGDKTASTASSGERVRLGDDEVSTASTEAPKSVHTFHMGMLPSSGRGSGSRVIAGIHHQEHISNTQRCSRNSSNKKEIPEVVVPRLTPSHVFKDNKKQNQDKNLSALDGNSMHSVLTEDSRSRVAGAREMWTSLSSLDYLHPDSRSAEKTSLLNDSFSSIEFSSAMEMWNNSESSINHIPSPRQEEKKFNSNDRASKTEDVPPTDSSSAVILGIGQTPPASQGGHTTSACSSRSKQWNESKTGCEKKKDLLHPPIPRHIERSKTTESVPDLEMSLTSLDTSVDESVLDNNVGNARNVLRRSAGGSLVDGRSSRPSEMLPLRPPTVIHKHIGGGGRKSVPDSRTIQHNARALNRPDDWLGGSRTKAKRSWTVKRIAESDLEVSAGNPDTVGRND